MMTRKKVTSSTAPAPAPSQNEISLRRQSLEARDRQWLNLHIELEGDQVRNDGPAFSAEDVSKLAAELMDGRGPAIPEKRKAQLNHVRAVRAAIKEAVETCQTLWTATGKSRAVTENAKCEYQLDALSRQRVELACQLQAVNRRWFALAKHIRGSAVDFPLRCEVPNRPDVLLGIGDLTHGATADYIRMVVKAGIITQGEVDRLLGDKEGK